MKRPSPIIRHELGHSGTTLEAMELRVTARVRSSYTASVDFGRRKLSNCSAASTLRFEKARLCTSSEPQALFRFS